MSADFARLREQIADIDRGLLSLLEQRFALAAEVGRRKAEQNQPIVVRHVEQNVLKRARDAAQRCGASPEVMEAIFAAILRASVERQHRIGVAERVRAGGRVLILGAAGGMGGWLRSFLTSLGHRAVGVDPSWSALPPTEERLADLADLPDPFGIDALFVATPLETLPDLLGRLATLGLKVPVVEIASIKNHLAGALDALERAGMIPLALHPMFGPGKNPYEPLTMVHAVRGNEARERAILSELLAHPYLDLVSIPFDQHDRLMGWLLGLAHLGGMLFGGALSQSGLDPAALGRIASTTFARQVSTARSVLEEDPDLYFAIQRLNPFRGEVYAALAGALEEITGAVERDDRETFSEFMTRAAGALPEL
jgi:prephenate dehydrogenase/chorismate mutase